MHEVLIGSNMELELGDLHALVSTPSDQPGAKIFSFFNLFFLLNFGGFYFILGTKIKVILDFLRVA